MNPKASPGCDVFPIEEDRLIKARTVRWRLDCSKATVRNLIQKGALTPIRIGGRSIRFSTRELDDFIETCKLSRLRPARAGKNMFTEEQSKLLDEILGGTTVVN